MLKSSLCALVLLALSSAGASASGPAIIKIGDSIHPTPEVAARLARGYLLSLGATRVEELRRGQNLWVYAQTGRGQVQIGISNPAYGESLRRLQGGEIDLALFNRRPSGGQPDTAPRLNEQVFALEALAVAGHRRNPLELIDAPQLRALLARGGGNWRELGGIDAPINLLASDRLATSSRQLLPVPDTAARLGAGELRKKLDSDPNALALVPLPLATDLHTLPLRSAGTLLPPTEALAASEDYPLTRRAYIYSRDEGGSPRLRDFIEFVLSDAGQQLVAKSGLVSLAPRLLETLPRRQVPVAYRELMQNGQRLSIAFRFDNGGSELDARAIRDIDRLADFLQKPEHRARKVALVGFSDRQRRDSMARTISEFRTVIVSRHLRATDIVADRTLSLGASAPLTTDKQLAGQRNARVEVWLL